MSRYIAAEWLKAELGDVNMDIYTDEVKEYIDSAPSIEIVRCRECRWQSVITDEEEGTSYYMCGVWAMPTDEDVFCSHGKRK